MKVNTNPAQNNSYIAWVSNVVPPLLAIGTILHFYQNRCISSETAFCTTTGTKLLMLATQVSMVVSGGATYLAYEKAKNDPLVTICAVSNFVAIAILLAGPILFKV